LRWLAHLYVLRKGGNDEPTDLLSSISPLSIPNLKPDQQPCRFVLDLPLPCLITYRHKDYLQDNPLLKKLVTFHNSSTVPASAISSSADAQPILINAGAVEYQDNSNVSKILPLTTLRTIDLRGRKNPGSLFSRFCGNLRVFFEVNVAPECVQIAARLTHISSSSSRSSWSS
jgi:hypothetical protein